MKVKFEDFYGQHVTVHNETSSGNVRVLVKTTKDLNSVDEDKCDIETDISLAPAHLKILIGALQTMEEE